jgi:hypothetical protein
MKIEAADDIYAFLFLQFDFNIVQDENHLSISELITGDFYVQYRIL